MLSRIFDFDFDMAVRKKMNMRIAALFTIYSPSMGDFPES